LRSRKQNTLRIIRILTDMFMVSIAWVLAYYIRFSGFIPIERGIPEEILYLKLTPFIWVIWLVVLAAFGFYRRTGYHRSAFVEGLDIVQSCFFATLAFVAFMYVYEEYRYSRLTLGIFSVLHPFGIITGRSLIRKALRFYRRKAPARKNLVIGGGDALMQAIDLSLEGHMARGEIDGVVLVGNAEQVEIGRKLCEERNISILPIQEDWSIFFSKHPVQTVVFALPYESFAYFDTHISAIVDQVPDVRLIPDLMKYTRFASGIDVIDGKPVLSINESPLVGTGSVIKRFIDIIGAFLGLIVLSPFLLLISFLVRVSSRGPILYKQERMGIDGSTFEILKFRSMPVAAEDKSGAVWASKGDDRATFIGRIIRRTSIDELPQLFNVIKGEMSLIGPRPERPVFVEQFRQKIPGYYLRHKVKAGLTGWAQVNGWRGNTSIEKRIECDLYYIQNWSLWLDIRIVFLTVLKGFTDKNAY